MNVMNVSPALAAVHSNSQPAFSGDGRKIGGNYSNNQSTVSKRPRGDDGNYVTFGDRKKGGNHLNNQPAFSGGKGSGPGGN